MLNYLHTGIYIPLSATLEHGKILQGNFRGKDTS